MEYSFNKVLFKKAKEKKGISYSQLAQMLTERGQEITVDGINFWFRDSKNKPEIEKIKVIAEILEVPFNELAIIDDEIKEGILGEYSEVKFVRIVGEASCGMPITSNFQDKNRYTYCSSNIWHKDLYGLIASGDSMLPDIEDRDEVICDPNAPITSGDIVHYKFLEEEAIKIFYDNKELKALEFIPYNQSDTFKTKFVRYDDENFNELTMAKVIRINKVSLNNRKSRLRLVGKA
ncbi:LexA family transcriptional regulator [Campylobacter curvus]|uniref:LexA family transcriptional regulator n=1 Tax=Campylobacter curvus TaxID=200 RepID=UPI00146FD201|nr:XRE family transcriptional regulator [Campylobacter curvus]